MELAIDQAKIALSKEETPIGCVIYDREKKKVISSQHNKTGANSNPLCHCELLSINEVFKKYSYYNLNTCDIYVTLEPCVMCLSAISHSGIGSLYYGASNESEGGVCNNILKYCAYKPNIYGGIMELDSKKLLKEFFENKRK